jgi:alpha-D-ribose 1-methylphosphonate 5-triphosphate synthase subunit PhnL
MTLLQVIHLSKHFTVHHLHREVPAFSDLSFEVRAGEFVLVAGPNGVGKSTLLRCLYRTYLPTAGQAHYHSRHGVIDLATAADVDILHLRREEIGHVTQFLRARPRVSALDFVAEPLLTGPSPLGGEDLWPIGGHGRGGSGPDTAKAQAADLLAAFGLKRELWDAYPTTFSGGEQQKVNLAHALIAPRRLLLLDEPTASLDVSARAALVDRLAQLKGQGVAMIGVFHHAEDVRPLVDKEIVLTTDHPQWVASDGQLTMQGVVPGLPSVVGNGHAGGTFSVAQ